MQSSRTLPDAIRTIIASRGKEIKIDARNSSPSSVIETQQAALKLCGLWAPVS